MKQALWVVSWIHRHCSLPTQLNAAWLTWSATSSVRQSCHLMGSMSSEQRWSGVISFHGGIEPDPWHVYEYATVRRRKVAGA